MKIILCLDDKNGMMFNKRRQSRDSVVIEDIQKMTKDSPLWMNNYSAKLFGEESLYVQEDFLEKAGTDDYCFVENVGLASYEEKIEEIVVYRWNRVYPADVYLDIELENNRYQKISEEILVGSSHPEIAKLTYRKE